MGLDMYLSAKLYTSEYSNKELNRELKQLADKHLPPAGNYDSIEIKRDVAYWRKANAIHAWFVKHVQNGNDDCGTYYVNRDELEDLRDTCLKVLGGINLVDGTVVNGWTYENGERKAITEPGQVVADPKLAQELLPTQAGFFFGGTDYNEHYVADLVNTVEQIDKLIAWCALTGIDIDFEYHSSW